MSERTIRVQPAELESESGKIRNYKGEFNGSYSDICTQARALTTTTWGGRDADEFYAKVDAFKKDFQAMEDILEAYSQFLHRSSEAYTNAQNDVVNRASNLSTKIG